MVLKLKRIGQLGDFLQRISVMYFDVGHPLLINYKVFDFDTTVILAFVVSLLSYLHLNSFS